MGEIEIVLLLLLCTIIAFISGKISFPIISMGIILTLVVSGIMKPEQAFSGFINKNVIMLAAMFVIGRGLTMTSLLDHIQIIVVRFKSSPQILLLISSVVAAILACLTNATACTTIMLPLILGLASETGISRSKFLYPIIVIANVSTGITVLGQGAGNLAWNEVMVKAGADKAFSLMSFPIARFPILIIAIFYVCTIGYRLMPDTPNENFTGRIGRKMHNQKLSSRKEKIAYVIITATVILMILSQNIGVDMYIISCFGACLLVLTGVLNENDALGSIRLNTIFLFAGVLALADAIKITGAGDIVADYMIYFMGNTKNPYVMMAFFFGVPFVMTQVMSNVACNAIFVPLAATACVQIGADPRAAVMGVLIAGCSSFLTPLAAPCQAMIMEPGGYQLKDYLKGGIPLAVIITIISIFYLPMLYPFYP